MGAEISNHEGEEAMSTKIENFVKAFIALNPAEKKQVVEIAKALESATPINESRIIKSLGMESLSSTINFAPTPGRCPTCGR